jgi:hypothetical protein
MADRSRLARAMWTLYEPIHDVTYFSPEARQAFEDAGLRGYWRGYFAGRAAPLGPVGAAPVIALFGGFAPSFVARALPAVWSMAGPDDALDARAAGAGAALRRLAPDVEGVEQAAGALERIVGELDLAGRALGAANADLPTRDDPYTRLWQATATLREHRGDGHVAALVVEGFDGCQAHVSLAATGAVPRTVLQPNRGWTDQQWDAAERTLIKRGWLDRHGRATDEGIAGRAAIEATTDRLASDPWQQLGAADTTALAQALAPLTRAVLSSGVIPDVNPMGLPTEL